MMFSELALWQEVALVGLALLSAVYVFYFRIWVALATGSDLLFTISLAVCIASIAAPAIFDLGARYAVDASPLPEALLEADAKVAALEALPGVLIDRALQKIGYEREAEALLAEAAPAPGPFENQIRPAVESLIAFLLRATSSISSFFLLLMALALRSSTSTAREVHELSTRLDRLALPATMSPEAPSSTAQA
jgi:hypothetical protein